MIQTANHRASRNRSAFSLVELLAALTLSAMIIAVISGLVVKMSLTRDTVIRERPFEPWKSLLLGQLQSDYSGCRSVKIDSRNLTIEGYATFAGLDGVSSVVPSTIQYKCISNDRGNWMYREQTNHLATPPDNKHKELVCRSLMGFQDLSGLTTDVAPGTIELGLISASTDNERSLSDRSPGVLRTVLVRHGMSQ